MKQIALMVSYLGFHLFLHYFDSRLNTESQNSGHFQGGCMKKFSLPEPIHDSHVPDWLQSVTV